MREPTPDPLPTLDPTRFVRLGLVFYGVLAVAAVVWRQGAYGEAIWEAPGAVAPLRDVWLPGVLVGLAVGTAVVVASFAATEWTAWGERLARSLAAQLPPLSVPDAVLLALASGLAEEMFFRGALQPRVGLVWASVLFGAMHLPSQQALVPWSLFAVAMGFALGALFDATGSLVAPVVAHTWINAVNLPLLVRRYGPPRR